MNREDMLRELELLPVWQLRNPLPQSDVKAEELASEADTGLVGEEPANVGHHEVEPLTEAPNHVFRLVMSEDAQWAFMLGQLDTEAEQLLQNILKAVNVKVGQDIAEANVRHLVHNAPKVIVVMGEGQAQQLLNNARPINEMRGAAHLWQGIPVIATYCPSHLVLNLADKAKTWEDLCLTKFTIASL